MQDLSMGRIEKMKILKLRNLFLASSALALVMLFGCSSSEEEAPPPAESGGGGGSCIEQCSSLPDIQQDECIIMCEA
jgi:hypothetical protein